MRRWNALREVQRSAETCAVAEAVERELEPLDGASRTGLSCYGDKGSYTFFVYSPDPRRGLILEETPTIADSVILLNGRFYILLKINDLRREFLKR